MFALSVKSSSIRRIISSCLLSTFISMIISSTALRALAQDEGIYAAFDRVSSLRAEGLYDEAIEILKAIIAEHAKTDDILRQAYNQLVYTFWQKQDLEAANTGAREALLRFPDIKADTLIVPARVNQIYDIHRAQMYGALSVVTKPDSCRVFLGSDFLGFSPIDTQYVTIGEYVLNVTKSGYKDESSTIRIEPAQPTSVPLSLQRNRDKKWWLWRAGPVAILAGALAIFGFQDDETSTPAEPEPLPGPPDPPGE